MGLMHKDWKLLNYQDIEKLKKGCNNPKCEGCNKEPEIGEKWHKYRTHIKTGRNNPPEHLIYCGSCWEKKWI